MSTLIRSPRRLAAATFLAILAGTSAGVSAADRPDDAISAGPGSLEEIVVTATRREESISKVPISITALSQNDLDQKGIRDFSEMVRFTPGVAFDTSGTNAISIRGISSSGGAGTTGIYIDDTPIQMRALGFNPDDTLPKTFDLDRVEVLRGPQGTLFGAGSEGGTVRYIMTQPNTTTDSTYARTELSFTRGGAPSYEAGIAHGTPLIDGVLGVRASVWFRTDGGWIDRVDDITGAVNEKNANYARTAALRLAFLWQPADNIKITPSIAYQNKQQHDISTFWTGYSNPASRDFHDASPERIPIPDQYYLPALKIQIDSPHVTFISNTSYYHRDEQDSYEGTVYDLAFIQALGWPGALYDGAPALGCGTASTTPTQPCSWYPLINSKGIHLPAGFTNFATPNTINNQQRSLTQEFRVQSNDEGKIRWTAGLFMQVANEESIEQLNAPGFNQFLSALYGGPIFDSQYGVGTSLPANIGNTLFGTFYSCTGAPGSTPQPASAPVPNCDIYYNRNKSYDHQIAGFGELTYKFTDQLSLTAGGRYAKLSFSLDHYANGYEDYGPSQAGGTEHETAFTPKLGLNYQLDDRNLFYATYAKGFRPGGYNPPLPPLFCGPGLVQDGFPSGQSPQTYNSDTTQSYEIGAKNNFNDRLKIASSVYYIQWNGIQQNVYVAGNCGLQFTDNLGTAVAKGFDFQANAILGGGVSMEASVGYTDAKFSKSSLNNLALAGDAISGEAAINYSPGTTAPWTIAVGPQLDFQAGDHEAFVRVDWEYTSRNSWLTPVQDPNSLQYNPFSYALPATSFVSLRSGVKIGNWQISAFIDNLFDSHTVLNYSLVQNDSFRPGGPLPPQENDFTFRPRTIGITATFKK